MLTDDDVQYDGGARPGGAPRRPMAPPAWRSLMGEGGRRFSVPPPTFLWAVATSLRRAGQVQVTRQHPLKVGGVDTPPLPSPAHTANLVRICLSFFRGITRYSAVKLRLTARFQH